LPRVARLRNRALARLREHRLARVAVVAQHAHLHEVVRKEREVDLVQDGGCEAVVADRDDRFEVMRLGAKRAADSVGV
jgi:hypothetical protein